MGRKLGFGNGRKLGNERKLGLGLGLGLRVRVSVRVRVGVSVSLSLVRWSLEMSLSCYYRVMCLSSPDYKYKHFQQSKGKGVMQS